MGPCLEERPIVANVPVGAVDSSLGEVTKEYQMILPSINESESTKIVISPFTSLLSDAVVQGINISNVEEEISLESSCGDIGARVATNIYDELRQIENIIESNLDLDYKDLFIDFIENQTASSITESAAQNIASFFPYLKEITDEFDSELTTIHKKNINTKVAIEKDSIQTILQDTNLVELPLSFSAIYTTNPNDLGWYIEEKISANGAKIDNSGQLKHFTCFTNSDNCITDSRDLSSLRNASKRYTRTSSFLNNDYSSNLYNYRLIVEDEQRVNFDINGNPNSRVCIYQNWLYLQPLNTKENFTSRDRYSTGLVGSGDSVDDCDAELSNKNESLFVALVDSYDDGEIFENIDIRITNPKYIDSTFFENKVNKIYENRDILDIDPLIEEIASIPRTFKDAEALRNKLDSSSTDQISIYWEKRDSSGNPIESVRIDIRHNPQDDLFVYGVFENSSSATQFTEVLRSEGLEAKNDLNNFINEKSIVFNNSDYINFAPTFISSASFNTDESATNIGTVVVNDKEGDSIVFSISGSEINIDPLSGVLTFITTPDYETKSLYSATVSADDGYNLATQVITININDVQENLSAPSFTSNATFTADENQTAIGTVTATDADGDDVTFTVSGSELAITSAGVLTFVSAPDHETKTSYTATVTATDGTNSTTQNITVSVNNLNDNSPSFTSNATFTADENQTAIGTVTATDADGDDVTFTVSGSELAITSAGVLTFVSAPDYETNASYTATVTATDGTNETNQEINVTINDVEENINAPSFTSNATFTADENQTAIGTVTATDPEGDSITFTISGNELSITSAGVLTFSSAPDYETKSSYSATVTATDGANSATQLIIVTVNNINDTNPVITSNNSFTADENQTAIGTVTATDADGDAVTFTVSGSELAITSAGVLTFVSAPDHETKTSYSATSNR